MSISIDSHEGGPIEGFFGSQVEQRVGHRDIDHEDELGHGRRISESSRSSSDSRMLGQYQHRPLAPSPRPTNRTWLRIPWKPWGKRPSGHNSRRTQHNHHHNSPWWSPRLLRRFSLKFMSTITSTTAAGDSAADAIRHIQAYMSTLMTTVVNSKRRKSWFLSLILISLVLTVLSGGYLLNNQKDVGPPATSLFGDDIPLDTVSGPRRDRNRGKKPQPPKKAPAGSTEKGQISTDKGKGAPKDTGVDQGSDSNDGSTDSEKHVGLEDKHDETENDEQSSPNTPAAPATRICNLGDVATGQWVISEEQGELPIWSMGQDLSWTGYGHNGCRSNIWNERYLLTPSVTDNSTARLGLLQKDRDYAWHLKKLRWQLDQEQDRQQQRQKQGQRTKDACQQPVMDVGDFVEVLKRAPLVMIGDKFLEQEYLAMECMILGMQDQLLHDSRSKKDGAIADDDVTDSLDYRIESEAPPIVELKVAPRSATPLATDSNPSTTAASRNRPAVYRKAKPGRMRLIDRQSNLTLITFIRSDVLWDSDMLAGQIAKHALKSAAELSNLDAGGLHPDCKLVGTVLMCEPAHIDVHRSESKATRVLKQAASHWWQWWIGSKGDGAENPVENMERGEDSDSDMSFGSDLDRDIINLEWVQRLEEIVHDSAEHRQNASKRQGSTEGDAERKPVVVISSGHFWEYDPRDAVSRVQQRSNKKLTKAEQDQIRESQDKRRKLLRQRYTMMMSNMLDYIKATYPDLRVVVQTSVRRSACKLGPIDAAEIALRDAKDQEAALLNALTKTVVARMQDPLYAFLDTTFLRVFKDPDANLRHCDSFVMPGTPLLCHYELHCAFYSHCCN
ncbi:hypothetical protein EDD21DRAFT_241160 [Dissophora ornata]|nr:hypothetical protein EDD21DRAFT_241160 [Dissophora ornata]